MDRKPFALFWELLKAVGGFTILYVQQDWFGLSTHFADASLLVKSYLIFSLGTSAWFWYTHQQEDRGLSKA